MHRSSPMHDFKFDASMVELVERHLGYGDRRYKEINAVITLPERIRKHWDFYWMDSLCVWKDHPNIRGYGGKQYRTVVGRWGPFLQVYQYDPDHAPQWNHPIIKMESGETREIVSGFYPRPSEVGEEEYVNIYYHLKDTGNLFSGSIYGEFLEYYFRQHKMNWEVVTNNNYSRLVVKEKKPCKISQEIYRSCREGDQYVAVLVWSEDDWAEHKREYIGQKFPSVEAAQEAINMKAMKMGL